MISKLCPSEVTASSDVTRFGNWLRTLQPMDIHLTCCQRQPTDICVRLLYWPVQHPLMTTGKTPTGNWWVLIVKHSLCEMKSCVKKCVCLCVWLCAHLCVRVSKYAYIHIFSGVFCQVLKSIHERFHRVLTLNDLKKVMHETQVKNEVISLLESMCGVTEATRVDNVNLLFQFLQPALIECVNILGECVSML